MKKSFFISAKILEENFVSSLLEPPCKGRDTNGPNLLEIISSSPLLCRMLEAVFCKKSLHKNI
jgi:hypothetical protein